MRRVLIVIGLLAIYAVVMAPVGADQMQGVKTTIWDVNGQNNAPALTEGQQPTCELDLEDISHNFDMEPLCGLTEDFIVHFEGWITYPETGQYRWQVQADDGARLYLDGVQLIDDWYDKGGGGSISDPIQATSGQTQHIDVWFYENGGSAWLQTWWSLNDVWSMTPITALTQSKPEQPSPTPTPIVTELVSPSPTQSPTITPQETQTPEPSSTPKETSTPSPKPIEQITVEPTQPSEPTPLATLGNVIPSYSPAPIIEQPTSITIQPNAPNTIPTRKFLNITIPDITKIGNDMTPEQREQSQAVVVAAVILGQIARFRR